MMERGGWGYVLLLSTAAAGLLLALWAAAGTDQPDAAESVHVLVEYNPENRLLHHGRVDLAAGAGHALGALQRAGQESDFDVAVSTEFWEPFVVSVAGHANEGACGWTFDINGTWSTRGAASSPVGSGDSVRWYWSCR